MTRPAPEPLRVRQMTRAQEAHLRARQRELIALWDTPIRPIPIPTKPECKTK